MVDKTTTGSNPQPEADQGDKDSTDAPQYVTREELNQIVNSAISKRTKTFEGKLDEFMTKFSPPENKAPEKEDKPSQADLVAMKKTIERLETEKQAETVKRRDTVLRDQLKDQLSKLGVPQHMIKAAVATLNEDRLVGYDEAEQIVFKTSDGELELASGLRNWIRSDDGKVFLPAKGIKGSGDRTYTAPGSKTNTDLSNESIAEKIMRLRS